MQERGILGYKESFQDEEISVIQFRQFTEGKKAYEEMVKLISKWTSVNEKERKGPFINAHLRGGKRRSWQVLLEKGRQDTQLLLGRGKLSQHSWKPNTTQSN